MKLPQLTFFTVMTTAVCHEIYYFTVSPLCYIKSTRSVVSGLYRGGFLASIATLRLKKEVIPSIVNLYREPPTTPASESYRIVGLRDLSLED